MPTVRFAGRQVECLAGSNLRMVLLRARLPLYNDAAQALNCRGRGVCGTCAVKIRGEVSPPRPAERVRLRLPPFDAQTDLRLACQITVLGDLEVNKLGGAFGHREEPE